MSTSYSEALNLDCPFPVSSFMYPDICAPAIAAAEEAKQEEEEAKQASERPAPGLSEQEVNDRVNRARAEAVAETERRLRAEYEAKSALEAEKIRHALEVFQNERKDYFSRVESDVVHLALAIAGKILHRESQVDPLLVAALVRFSIEQLHDGSSVSVRVVPAEAAKWRERFAIPSNGSTISIVEDASLSPYDCVLETDVGSANFSIDAQLKEVETGFFDLLAQRPPVR
jgi:flagellar assembly protein FliH